MKPVGIIESLDTLPASQLVTLAEAGFIARRSRASLYRDHHAGVLPFVKVGNSTRVRVGDLRKLIGAAA